MSCGGGNDLTASVFVPISDRAKAEAAERDLELGGIRPVVFRRMIPVLTGAAV